MKFKHIIKFYLVFYYSLITIHDSFSQQFSVLTCSRGKEIYSTFGHSAIRYQDSALGIDWVYNYGLFDFYDPNFIPKFCMGKLDYMVGKETMNDFIAQYIYQQREVREQVLNLNPNQRDSLLNFLEWNILDENKYYRYDFLYNNCATKIIDVLEKNCKGLEMKFYEDKERKSFRKLIHINAENTVPWIDWGMDIGLGTPADKLASDSEYCFLPIYVSKAIQLSKTNGHALTSTEQILIPKNESLEFESRSWYSRSDFIIIIIVFLLIIQIYRPLFVTKYIFSTLFFILGIGGLVIGFEWFFTEHSVTKWNWNLLWLNPLYLLQSYYHLKKIKKKWLNYFLLASTIIAFIIISFIVNDYKSESQLIIVFLLFYWLRYK